LNKLLILQSYLINHIIKHDTTGPRGCQELSRTYTSLWFNPELERLKQIGSVSEDYQPEAMQVILFPNNEKHILFDQLVIPKEKLKANIKYRDCGHVTFKKDPYGNWHGFFDFRYNKGRSKELFDTALQYFEAAKDDYKAGRLRVFPDNLSGQQNYFFKAYSL
jgi:hypothetical protein